MRRTVLITTAHGMFGGALLRQLTGSSAVQVRAMVRRRRPEERDEGNLSYVEADLDEPDGLPRAVEGVSEVFLTTPMDERIAARECALIDAVRVASPQVRVVILYGAVDHQGDPLVSQHQQAIAHLQGSGLRWTILSPNSVMETALLPLADTVPWGGVMGSSGQGRVGFIALADVARVAARVIEQGSHGGEELVVTGPEALSLPQVCQLLGQELGRRLRFLDLPEAQLQRLLLSDGSFGDAAQIETEVLCHLRAWRRGGAERVTDTVEQVTGTPAQTAAGWLQEHREAFGRRRRVSDRLLGLLMRLRFGRFRLEPSA